MSKKPIKLMAEDSTQKVEETGQAYQQLFSFRNFL